MKKNSKNILKEVEDFFAAPRTSNQKAWGIINDFYNFALIYMEENNINQAELARRLNKSRSAISQMFRKTPNISIKRMVEIADAIGFEFRISSNNIEVKEEKVKYIIVVHHKLVDDWNYDLSFDKMQAGDIENPDKATAYSRGYYGK